MTTASTIKVIFKGEDWKYTQKFLVYGDVKLDRDDPTVKECLDAARNCLSVIPEDEEIKCSLVNK